MKPNVGSIPPNLPPKDLKPNLAAGSSDPVDQGIMLGVMFCPWSFPCSLPAAWCCYEQHWICGSVAVSQAAVSAGSSGMSGIRAGSLDAPGILLPQASPCNWSPAGKLMEIHSASI